MTTVEVETSGKDVGAGETLEAELGTVCATSNGHYVAEATSLFDGAFGDVCNLGLVLQLAQHIIILVLHFCGHCVLSVFGVQLLGYLGHHLLALLELAAVVVANDVTEPSLFHTATHARQMEEPFVSFCCFRPFIRRH